jgi:hypothetical protein
MTANSPIARRVLALLATALLSSAILSASAHAAHAPRHHKAARHHVRHRAGACGARAARHRSRRVEGRHRRAVCARAASIVPVVRFVTPVPQADVPADGVLRARVKVHSPSPVDYVAFRIDGKLAKTDRTHVFSYACRADTLLRGAHRVRAVAVDAAGHHRSDAVTVDVTAPAGADTAWAQGRTWASSFETGDFTEWSWWGQGDSSYAHRAVIDPRTEGVPRLGGDHVARFETTPDDIANGRVHAKLYRGFGTNFGQPDSRSPADVSGTYSAWYYIPETYRVPDHTYVNMFQFKEEYQTASGKASDPLWWVQLGPVHWADGMSQGYGGPAITGRSDAPVAFLNYWNSSWGARRNFVPLPLGRWFKLKAVVHQGSRIDFSIDGQPLDTARASTYPVSPFHGADSLAWTFGIGNYSTGANGPMYADRVSYTGP